MADRVAAGGGDADTGRCRERHSGITPDARVSLVGMLWRGRAGEVLPAVQNAYYLVARTDGLRLVRREPSMR